MKNHTIALLIVVFYVCGQHSTAQKLWYTAPAKNWSKEALPIGNGRIGAMFFGGVSYERIQFNEQSLWEGDNNWAGESKKTSKGFGAYQNFGEIQLAFKGITDSANYCRELHLSKGIHRTTFKSGSADFKREAFASYPNNVIVIRYTSSRRQAISGILSLHSAHPAQSSTTSNQLMFQGQLENQLQFAAVLKVENSGGKVTVSGNSLSFEGCNALTLYLNARTNYKPDYKSNWRSAQLPLQVVLNELSQARKNNYAQLKEAHIADVNALFERATIDIGTTQEQLSSLPTNERLKRYSKGAIDPDLEETMFQYGRYLLFSSSRPGGLPANLQGLWNDSNTPPWSSDYHNNINVQMNYWAAETTNLSECHLPLMDYIQAQAEPCRVLTRKAFGENMRGWTARTAQNIYGGNGFLWNMTASAWYAQHAYEHFAFTQDMNYLKNTAYPMLKEICQFWEDNLKRMPDGTLMVPNGWSPEHGPQADGVMYDQQVVWDLFSNYLALASKLQIDKAYQVRVATMQKQLAPNKIGKWGQLQEWQDDIDNPDDLHRHTSHLFAVFPGRQISYTTTPDLAKAANISLRARSGNYGTNSDKTFTVESTTGDSRRSWTWPWRCAIWARLGEGEKAGMMIRGLLSYNTFPNLFCSCPVFQIDGNLGIPGAMSEMLLQSQNNEIALLPALPTAWAAKGSFKGLKARGGFTVDCEWENGKVLSYKITSAKVQPLQLRVNGKLLNISSEKQLK